MKLTKELIEKQVISCKKEIEGYLQSAQKAAGVMDYCNHLLKTMDFGEEDVKKDEAVGVSNPSADASESKD